MTGPASSNMTMFQKLNAATVPFDHAELSKVLQPGLPVRLCVELTGGIPLEVSEWSRDMDAYYESRRVGARDAILGFLGKDEFRSSRVRFYFMGLIEAPAQPTERLVDRFLDKRVIGLVASTSCGLLAVEKSAGCGGEHSEEEKVRGKEEAAAVQTSRGGPQTVHLVYSFLYPAAREAFVRLLPELPDAFLKDEGFFSGLFRDGRLSESAKGNAAEAYIIFRIESDRSVQMVTETPKGAREDIDVGGIRSRCVSVPDLHRAVSLPWELDGFLSVPRCSNFPNVDFVLWDGRTRTVFGFQVSVASDVKRHIRGFNATDFLQCLWDRQLPLSAKPDDAIEIVIVWVIPGGSRHPRKASDVLSDEGLGDSEVSVRTSPELSVRLRHVVALFGSQQRWFPSLVALNVTSTSRPSK